jgi:t-SNARE complex subunit (syntaxin)
VANKKNPGKTKPVPRSMRIQQIIFLTICVIIILAMVLSLATKF